ncbi:MAG TPA: dihydroorotase [Gillisia sp.]|nr:dihydroorotase [Gillisia sp.]
MRVLLRSVKVIDPNSSFHKKKTDIFINDGIIADIGNSLQVNDIDREINIKGLHVSRGWFDSSVSFGEPGYEERETILHGLETAARSGFTGIVLNPATNPVIDDNGAVTSVLSKANGHPVKMYPSGALTRKSQGKDLAELYDMKQAGAVAFGDYKKSVMNPNLLKLALQYAQNFNALVQSYPQDDHIAGKGLVNEDNNSTLLGLKGIPSLAEELHITRDLAILEYTGGKLHIPTISTARAVKLIKDAKKKGLDVTCSVSIHNLVFTDDLLHEFDTNAKVLPPLRNKKDIAALQKGIKDGTIDMVTSDHNPVDVEHKKVEFEHALFGTTGLETAFGALLHLTHDVETTVELLSRGRERFGLEEPQVEKGKQANLSLFSPEVNRIFKKEEIFSTSKNSIFLGHEITGKVYGIISGTACKIWD